MHSFPTLITRIFLTLLSVAGLAAGFELPARTTQCLLGIADGWNDSQVTLCLYERRDGKWQPCHAPWQGRLGKNGLVWGLGTQPLPPAAARKKEGDQRSPAGVFAIGGAWGYERAIKKNAALPYRQITPRDLWVEDPTSAQYNQHVLLDHLPSTAWEKKQQMKQGDAAHSLKLFIGHNAPPRVIAGAGSSIFFHIWRRDGAAPTAGCTTMKKTDLQWLISQIDPAKHPLYILLPRAEYEKYRPTWKLP
jgi:L,D-peptidoglycan transpeptidase YkuD (ErfK/YbiS/YcfS/YnhG family)